MGEAAAAYERWCTHTQDFITLNERVVASDAELPENIRYATYYNRDRDAINAALFEEHCARMFTMYGHNDAIMVFSNKLKIRNGSAERRSSPCQK